MLANVALIEARDRAEEQEMMRIRQEDAQKALQRALSDVSSSGEHPHQEQEGPGMQNDSTNTTASDIRGEQGLGLEGKVKEVASPELNGGTLAQANGLKIRPPAFLTPSKSQKSRATTPISSSVFTASLNVTRNTGRLMQSSFGRESKCQQKTETAPVDTDQFASSDSACIQTQESLDVGNSLPVMPSRVTETESWTPKARARGR